MKLAEITITLAVPRQVSDIETDMMVEAYVDLDLPTRIRQLVEDAVYSRIALQDVRIMSSEV